MGDVCDGLWQKGAPILRGHASKTTRMMNDLDPYWENKAKCAAHVLSQTTCNKWELLPPAITTATWNDREIEEKLATAAKFKPGDKYLTIEASGKCAGMPGSAVLCKGDKCFQRFPRAYEGVQVSCGETTHKGYGCTCDGISLTDGILNTAHGNIFESCRFDGWAARSGWDNKYVAPVKKWTPPPVDHSWNQPSPDAAAEAVIDAASHLVETGKSLSGYKITAHRNAKGEYVATAVEDHYNKPCDSNADCGGISPYCVDVETHTLTQAFGHHNKVCKECIRDNGRQCQNDAGKPTTCIMPGLSGKGAGKCTKNEYHGNVGAKCYIDDDCGLPARYCEGFRCKECFVDNGTQCGKNVCNTKTFKCDPSKVFTGNVGADCKSRSDCAGPAHYCDGGKCKQCFKDNNTQCSGKVCDTKEGKCTSNNFVGNIGAGCSFLGGVVSNPDCAGTAKYCFGSTCKQCFVDNGKQCSGKVCDVTHGKCTNTPFVGNLGQGCTDDSGCGGTSPHCAHSPSMNANICMECASNADCTTEGRRVCDKNVGKCSGT